MSQHATINKKGGQNVPESSIDFSVLQHRFYIAQTVFLKSFVMFFMAQGPIFFSMI